MRIVALIAALALAIAVAHARTVFEPRGFTSPENEERYRTLVDELRCLVCQNQTIAESNADLASDLRREVYRMVEDGRSEDEIAGFMVARYGDFVLYRPPLRGGTILLWTGPFLLAAVGVTVLAVHLRCRRRTLAAPLDAEERRRESGASSTPSNDSDGLRSPLRTRMNAGRQRPSSRRSGRMMKDPLSTSSCSRRTSSRMRVNRSPKGVSAYST